MVAGRILVIEDDAGTAEVILESLRVEGYDARWVLGAEAVVAAQSFVPDVVLLDLVMPEPDGYEVASQLRGNPQTAQIPIVLMTAAARPDEAAEGMGVAGVLPKPFDLDDLLSLVRRLQRRTGGRPGQAAS